jgi:hypothetical protein
MRSITTRQEPFIPQGEKASSDEEIQLACAWVQRIRAYYGEDDVEAVALPVFEG